MVHQRPANRPHRRRLHPRLLDRRSRNAHLGADGDLTQTTAVVARTTGPHPRTPLPTPLRSRERGGSVFVVAGLSPQAPCAHRMVPTWLSVHGQGLFLVRHSTIATTPPTAPANSPSNSMVDGEYSNAANNTAHVVPRTDAISPRYLRSMLSHGASAFGVSPRPSGIEQSASIAAMSAGGTVENTLAISTASRV